MDIFKDLTECSFRGIAFPIINIDEQRQHDLVPHLRMDRNVAFVEDTGIGSATYQLTIPFVPGLRRGVNETWKDLFPTTFLAFRKAWEDRSNGTLIHPYFGEKLVKSSTWALTLDAEQRGGLFVTASFMETVEDRVDQVVNSSDVAIAKESSAALDSDLDSLSEKPTEIFTSTDKEANFSQCLDTILKTKNVTKISETIDKINKTIVQVNRQVDVLTNVNNVPTNLGPLGNGIVRIWQNAENLKYSLQQIQQKLLQNLNKNISTYTNIRPELLLSIAKKTKNSVQELRDLNILPRLPILPPLTIIRYYQKD